MKHPDSDVQQNQEAFLKNCPDDQREFHARMFRIGNAALHYHRQAQQLEDPTIDDYHHWLEGLPAHIREDMEADGFEKCKTYLPFTRHVMERRDIGINAWMQQHLSEDDYSSWKESRK